MSNIEWGRKAGGYNIARRAAGLIVRIRVRGACVTTMFKGTWRRAARREDDVSGGQERRTGVARER